MNPTKVLALLLCLLFVACRDSSPFVKDGQLLMDKITPPSFELVHETSEGDSAIRVFIAPAAPAPADALRLPKGYEVTPTRPYRGLFPGGSRTVGAWLGPSPARGNTCLVILGVLPGRVPNDEVRSEKVELNVSCGLRD